MREIKIMGHPFSFGQPHRGVEEAPMMLRMLGLIGELEKISTTLDLGDLDFSLCQRQLPLEIIKKSSQNSLANEFISGCIESEDLSQSFLLNLGGDHGMGLGTVHGMLMQNPETVVIWADAHGDVNTPTSSASKNFHGMPLSFLMNISNDPVLFPWIKRSLPPERLILVGPRDLDPVEKEIIEDLRIQYLSSEEMNKFGTRHLLKRALEKVDPNGDFPIHLSFDVDLFDSRDIISTGTRVGCGPYMPEIFNLGRTLAETGRLRSMDLVELNPKLGYETEMLRTFKLALNFTQYTIRNTFERQFRSGIVPSEIFRPIYS